MPSKLHEYAQHGMQLLFATTLAATLALTGCHPFEAGKHPSSIEREVGSFRRKLLHTINTGAFLTIDIEHDVDGNAVIDISSKALQCSGLYEEINNPFSTGVKIFLSFTQSGELLITSIETSSGPLIKTKENVLETDLEKDLAEVAAKYQGRPISPELLDQFINEWVKVNNAHSVQKSTDWFTGDTFRGSLLTFGE